jgi:hypothetical protein
MGVEEIETYRFRVQCRNNQLTDKIKEHDLLSEKYNTLKQK